VLDSAGVSLFVKCEHLRHPQLGGNKWHKLKYNLLAARTQQQHTLLTFGGAYSNHLYATAAAGQALQFNTIGIIRGEAQTPLNPTLKFASACGMQLHYISRQMYRDKDSTTVLQALHKLFGEFYLIAQGGSNLLALQGCREMIAEIMQPFDVFACACGTGTTLAGSVLGLGAQQSALGISVLRHGGALHNTVRQLLTQSEHYRGQHWHIDDRFHAGGYARTTNALWDFMDTFKTCHAIELDAVYTGKLFYALFNMIAAGEFAAGTRILALHSGGLQGNSGFKRGSGDTAKHKNTDCPRITPMTPM
jgi:1-aminocyclopropane-1-carboxylate deaminase/D-cysteine desulfhydrase-like pyridoxal-dependent ACC family enzyme